LDESQKYIAICGHCAVTYYEYLEKVLMDPTGEMKSEEYDGVPEMLW
jgi:hypothetical protein